MTNSRSSSRSARSDEEVEYRTSSHFAAINNKSIDKAFRRISQNCDDESSDDYMAYSSPSPSPPRRTYKILPAIGSTNQGLMPMRDWKKQNFTDDDDTEWEMDHWHGNMSASTPDINSMINNDEYRNSIKYKCPHNSPYNKMTAEKLTTKENGKQKKNKRGNGMNSKENLRNVRHPSKTDHNSSGVMTRGDGGVMKQQQQQQQDDPMPSHIPTTCSGQVEEAGCSTWNNDECTNHDIINRAWGYYNQSFISESDEEISDSNDDDDDEDDEDLRRVVTTSSLRPFLQDFERRMLSEKPSRNDRNFRLPEIPARHTSLILDNILNSKNIKKKQKFSVNREELVPSNSSPFLSSATYCSSEDKHSRNMKILENLSQQSNKKENQSCRSKSKKRESSSKTYSLPLLNNERCTDRQDLVVSSLPN